MQTADGYLTKCGKALQSENNASKIKTARELLDELAERHCVNGNYGEFAVEATVENGAIVEVREASRTKHRKRS